MVDDRVGGGPLSTSKLGTSKSGTAKAPPKPPAAPGQGPGRADPLLVELLTQHLDPGYRAAADRRGAEQGNPARIRPPAALVRRHRLVTAVVLLLTGILLSIAYQQTRARAPQAARTHAELVSAVRQRTADVDALTSREQDLAKAVEWRRAEVLADSAQGAATTAKLGRLRDAAAQSAVDGQGMVVMAGDAAESDAVGGGPRNGTHADSEVNRVLDRDLQQMVNALWAGGAQAISVGGQRLGPTSTIREAGSAVLVDFRPLSSPYRIVAIGDPDKMEPAFAESEIAQSFTTYPQLYGMTFSTRRESRLQVPAVGSHTVSFAHPLPSATPAPAGTSPAGGSSQRTGSGAPRSSPTAEPKGPPHR